MEWLQVLNSLNWAEGKGALNKEFLRVGIHFELYLKQINAKNKKAELVFQRQTRR